MDHWRRQEFFFDFGEGDPKRPFLGGCNADNGLKIDFSLTGDAHPPFPGTATESFIQHSKKHIQKHIYLSWNGIDGEIPLEELSPSPSRRARAHVVADIVPPRIDESRARRP